MFLFGQSKKIDPNDIEHKRRNQIITLKKDEKTFYSHTSLILNEEVIFKLFYIKYKFFAFYLIFFFEYSYMKNFLYYFINF